MEIAHHALQKLVGPLGRNKAFGLFQRNRKRGPQARRGADEMRGSFRARGLRDRLADRLAKGDAHAAVVERPHKAKGYRGEPDFGSAGCEIKRVRHEIMGLS